MEKVSKNKPVDKKDYETRTLRLPPSWWKEIEKKAEADLRSQNKYLEVVIGKALGKLKN